MTPKRIKLNSEIANKILKKAKIKEELKKVEEFYIGWNSIYLITTNKNKYILRFYTSNFGKLGKDWKAKKEEYVLKALQKRGVKTQRVYLADVSKSILPYNYLLVSHVPGIEFKKIDGTGWKKKDKSLSRTDHKAILQEAGKQMALIHSSKMPRLEIFGFKLDKNLKWEPEKHLNAYLKRCPDVRLRRRIKKYAIDKLSILPSKPKIVPVHTEMTSHNILVKKEKGHWKYSSLIDMEWFMRCIPERDLARQTYELFEYHLSKKAFVWKAKAFFKGYYKNGGKIDYPELIPLMVIDNLLWGCYTPERCKINLKLAKDNLRDSDKLINYYKRILKTLR